MKKVKWNNRFRLMTQTSNYQRCLSKLNCNNIQIQVLRNDRGQLNKINSQLSDQITRQLKIKVMMIYSFQKMIYTD